MKSRNYLRVSILSLVLILAGSASTFAKDTYKVTLHNDMTLNGTQLVRGEYNISWVAHSPEEATITVVSAGNVVTIVNGRLVEANSPHTQNTVVYDRTADGTRIIRELRLVGSGKTIVFD